LIVTTIEKPGADAVERARRLAAELDCAYVRRERHTLRGLARRRKDAADGVLVVGPDSLKLAAEDGPPLFFHPSMALVRAKRLRDGEADAMIRAAGADAGDSVLDCTAGLGSDALVFSYAVGPEGDVTALETSRVLHAIVREGMRTYESGLPDIDGAMRRIRHVRADHAEYLRGLPDKSVDIVYFDPMFSKPVLSSASLLPLRSVAEGAPLAPGTVEEAKRVARKSVVLKEHRDGSEFERLGFERIRMTAHSVAYGVIRI